MSVPIEHIRNLQYILHSNAAYKILGNSVSTWIEGGCLLLAMALKRVFPQGEILCIYDGEKPDPDHCVLKLGDVYLDGDGVQSETELLNRWKTEEFLKNPRIGPFKLMPDWFCPPDLVGKLAIFLEKGLQTRQIPNPALLVPPQKARTQAINDALEKMNPPKKKPTSFSSTHPSWQRTSAKRRPIHDPNQQEMTLTTPPPPPKISRPSPPHGRTVMRYQLPLDHPDRSRFPQSRPREWLLAPDACCSNAVWDAEKGEYNCSVHGPSRSQNGPEIAANPPPQNLRFGPFDEREVGFLVRDFRRHGLSADKEASQDGERWYIVLHPGHWTEVETAKNLLGNVGQRRRHFRKQDYRKEGEVCWFEAKGSSEELQAKSRQQVEIVSLDSRGRGDSLADRLANKSLARYTIRFHDGSVAQVNENELLDNPERLTDTRVSWYQPSFSIITSAKKKVLAVDFDETIAQYADYPDIGDPMEGVQEGLLKFRKAGWKIVIYTCRLNGHNHKHEDYQKNKEQISEWLKKHEIPYDDFAEWREGKIFADVYLDDKGWRFTTWKNAVKILDCD